MRSKKGLGLSCERVTLFEELAVSNTTRYILSGGLISDAGWWRGWGIWVNGRSWDLYIYPYNCCKKSTFDNSNHDSACCTVYNSSIRLAHFNTSFRDVLDIFCCSAWWLLEILYMECYIWTRWLTLDPLMICRRIYHEEVQFISQWFSLIGAEDHSPCFWICPSLGALSIEEERIHCKNHLPWKWDIWCPRGFVGRTAFR